MPNISPKGLFGRAGTSGAGLAAIEVWGTLPGSTVVRAALEVWASGANGVPVLVWASAAGAPSAVTATYDANQNVVISWTPAAAADSYVVKRPDGSTVTTVSTSYVTDMQPRALSGAYTVTPSLGAQTGSPVASNSLNLTTAPSAVTATLVSGQVQVQVGWNHPAYGQPSVGYRIDRNGVTAATLGKTITTWTDTNPPAGQITTYAVVPLHNNSTTGTSGSDTEGVPAAVPTGVTLVPFGSNNLRLAWSHPSGSRTGYTVERNVSSWVAHQTLGSSILLSDWATSVPGSMRVRTDSAGGASAWVTLGPVAPGDPTPPGLATITSWKPETSYGRLVVRATMPNDSDMGSYRIRIRLNSGGEYTAIDWVGTTPGASINVPVLTGSAGESYRVRVDTRDTSGNITTGPTSTYTLAASPITVEPQWPYSDTYKVNAGYWRGGVNNYTGGNLYLGWNMGCFFYGTECATRLAGKTVVGVQIEYARLDYGGNSGPVAPVFVMHNAVNNSGGQPSTYDGGSTEANRTGPGVSRYGTTAAFFSLPASWGALLQGGTWKGVAMYRPYYCSDSGDGTDTCYMVIESANWNWTGNPTVQNGLLTFSHLG